MKLSIFSERLREQRQKSGKKLAAMAQLLSVEVRSYQAYEEGTREPKYDKLVLIAKELKVSTDYLLGLKDRP